MICQLVVQTQWEIRLTLVSVWHIYGFSVLLPGAQAFICWSGTAVTVRNETEQSFQQTFGRKICSEGWGCQDTLMLLENGPQVLLVFTKGCTQEEDQEARVTQHRAGPGLSIVSYTHVCRHKDLCNDLSTTLPFWNLSPPAGSVRCPVCLSTEGCESVTEVTCPIGHSHCYNRILKLREGGINSKLRVQGCMSQAACNLLNETREIGPLSVSENCNTDAFRTCQQGLTLWAKPNSSKELEEWNTFKNVTCFLEEVCQETLLLIDVGPSSLIVGSKGCGRTETQNSKTLSIYLSPPGMVAASYANFCSSNGYNSARSTSLLLNSIHHSGELSEDENNDLQSGAAAVPYMAQVVGLGLSLALCCGMTSMLTLFPYVS
ncbi:LOW QUALITY PROTEIN: CD177 antigen-like [Phyllostomus discolor]|uniref:LOW QUALITY PROTEIN: CD177 antigen-like n=1 Tax=Phyllostomus discolor TaxID=89673 RepID=A0A6J2N257_9CHIR|nr:LOW QUALITY PROTEIN: CD177 antigen-like [Phyllostomus discolor]